MVVVTDVKEIVTALINEGRQLVIFLTGVLIRVAKISLLGIDSLKYLPVANFCSK